MSLSKHQRDIPQPCILAIVSQMSLSDRINAHQISPEWYHQVREVNRTTVKSLTIAAEGEDVAHFEDRFRHYKLRSFSPSMRLLAGGGGGKFAADVVGAPQLPLRRLNARWNCLLFGEGQLSPTTAAQLTATFPFITELVFLCSGKLELLTLMLATNEDGGWRRRLISLKVIFIQNLNINIVFYAKTYSNLTVLQPLFTAINSLQALKHLQLTGVGLCRLPILARLQSITISFCCYQDVFISSLEKYARQNQYLSVQIDESFTADCISKLLSQERPSTFNEDDFRGRITCLGCSSYTLGTFQTDFHRLSLITASFSSLTTLSLFCCPAASDSLSQVFQALSALARLQHLALSLIFSDDLLQQQQQITKIPPQAPLPAVKGLDLHLHLYYPWQVTHLLNLPVTMPNLQAVHLSSVDSCRERAQASTQNLSASNPSHRLRERVLQLLHRSTRIPVDRLSYQDDDDSKYYNSAGQLLWE